MKVRLTLNVLTASLLLAACAQTQPRQELNILPLQEVRHSYGQAKAQYGLGRYYHGQLRYERAIEAYRRALALDPTMLDAMNALGAAYAERGDFSLAREQFEAALKLQPDSVYTYNNLGFVNYLAGDYPEAVAAYKQALRLDGRHEKARHNLMLVMDRMGQGDHVARTQVPDPDTATQAALAAAEPVGSAAAWVQVSPVIYEMHSAVAPATPARAVSGADGTMAAGVASLAKPGAGLAGYRSDVETRVAARRLAPASSAPAVASDLAVAVSAPRTRAVAMAETVKAPAAQGIKVRGVEVSNGNGIRGLAAVVAQYLSGKGIGQTRLTNQKPFAERRTRIEYRPGSAAEAAVINGLLPRLAPQVATNNLKPGVRVRVVLGHDLGRDLANWGDPAGAPLVTAEFTKPGSPKL